ncbi:MAG: hypothetical protein IKC38_07115 [Clostridia bacterium]|nr:hypothetical protein [Clostridia bacterium]
MFDSSISAVIYIETETHTIHFYADTGNKVAGHMVATYSGPAFNEEFFEKLEKIITAYSRKDPAVSLAKTSLVLPDYMFVIDTVNVPALGKRAIETSVNLAIGTIYKNKDQLEIHTFPMLQNKEIAKYGLVAIRKDVLSRITNALARGGANVVNITSVTNATVNGAMFLSQKIKNDTFMLMDVKEKITRFAIVNKGRTIGGYQLPFGYSMLSGKDMVYEHKLFDHAGAELMVLNSKERAKAKKLTIMGEEVLVDAAEESNLESASEPSGGGRKMPKYMTRPMPEKSEDIMYENFRLMTKWAWELRANNPEIMAIENVNVVYVNLPKQVHFLIDKANEEALREQETGIKFMPLAIPASGIGYSRELDLYGANFVKQYNKINNF